MVDIFEAPRIGKLPDDLEWKLVAAIIIAADRHNDALLVLLQVLYLPCGKRILRLMLGSVLDLNHVVYKPKNLMNVKNTCIWKKMPVSFML